MTITSCMVPEIWNVDKQKFSSFWTIFCLFTPSQPKNWKFRKNKKKPWLSFYTCVPQWQSCDVWFLRYWVRRTEFFVILDHFLPFYPPSNPKNENFEKKMKKTLGDIIILHKCTINDNHMYGSWDMKRDRHNVLSFFTVFCPFTPLTTWKI